MTRNVLVKTLNNIIDSLVCGIGELDVGVSSQPPPQPHPPSSSSLPYLLLDVRDKESYDQCHIIGGDQQNCVIMLYLILSVIAHSYPAVTLSRSCNYFTREILDFVSILIQSLSIYIITFTVILRKINLARL